MRIIRLIFILGLTINNFTWAQLPQPGRSQTRPNIIIIYTDDMGIGDVSFARGAVGPTPNLDKLAREGKVFTQYYTNAPVCSPSRVALITGMYPLRWNINTFLNDRRFNKNCEQSDYLNQAAPTIARYLKTVGYKTAHFGKWHMGGGRDVTDAPSIAAYGFDAFASTYESPNPDPLLTSKNWIWAPTDSIKRWNRTAYFVDKTLDFLQQHPNAPCFINLWPDDVHSPWVAAAEWMQEREKGYYSLANLKPVIAEYDRQIGRLMDELKKRNLSQHTMVIFTSDNGPAPSFDRLRTNGLRGVKNSLYEGGILMPFVVHWPGKIAAGTVDAKSVIAAMDILPTLCRITGAKLPGQQTSRTDGEDFSVALFSSKPYIRKQDIFWEYGRNQFYNYPGAPDRSPQLAVRHGNWKLFTNPEGTQAELYNLTTDPQETKDLSAANPKLTAELKTKAVKWFRENDKQYSAIFPK